MAIFCKAHFAILSLIGSFSLQFLARDNFLLQIILLLVLENRNASLKLIVHVMTFFVVCFIDDQIVLGLENL